MLFVDDSVSLIFYFNEEILFLKDVEVMIKVEELVELFLELVESDIGIVLVD